MKFEKLNIIGCGGHARSIVSSFCKQYDILGLYDDTFSNEQDDFIFNYPLKGVLSNLEKDISVTIAIGNLDQRKRLFNNFRNFNLPNLIHSTTSIQEPIQIGIGNQFLPNSFVNGGCTIGDNNIFNTSCIIEHEANVGSHCHLSIRSVVAGKVKIGDNVFIGANATIIDGIKVCNDVVIGAGAVVVSDITEPGVYVGNPIRKFK